MSIFQPAPTYSDPVIIDKNKKPGDPGYAKFSPTWLKWFLDMVAILNSINNGQVSSNILHNQTSGLQGGGAGEEYHFTAVEYAGGGTGIFIRKTGATLVNTVLTNPSMTTPTLGVATATSIKPAASGYLSSDNSSGISTTITTDSLVGKTITVKDGIITGFA